MPQQRADFVFFCLPFLSNLAFSERGFWIRVLRVTISLNTTPMQFGNLLHATFLFCLFTDSETAVVIFPYILLMKTKLWPNHW